MRSHNIFGVRVDDLSAVEVKDLFSRWLHEGAQKVVVTPNPEFLLLARHDEYFRQILNSADLSLADGTGLRFAIPALTGTLLANQMTGVEALMMLTELCRENNLKLVTVGSSEADVDAGPVVSRVGDAQLSVEVVNLVASMSPAVVAVGLGQGKQEAVIARHHQDWPTARILIGVGGAIDMLAGRQRRAPEWLRRLGLEWAWRLVTEPRRIKRIVRAVAVFPALVVWTTLRQRRFMSACRVTIPEIFRQLIAR